MRFGTAANVITCFGILASVALLFCPVFSLPFNVLYLAAGISDMIDGAVARKTNTVSEFGARLDTIADCVFVSACLIKLLPALHVPGWFYIWTAFIAMIKLFNIAVVVCLVATIAAVNEGHLVRKRRKTNERNL